MNIEKIIHRVYTQKPLRISLHLFFWLGLLMVQLYLTAISFNPLKNVSGSATLQLSLAGIISLAIFYYPFVYYILPRLFYKKRFFFGIVATLALIIVYTLCTLASEQFILLTCHECMVEMKKSNTEYFEFLQKSVINRMLGKILSGGAVIGLFFSLCIPLSIKMALSAFRQQILSLKLAKENVELEFNFLKAQVNPHFLFNALNNIYGLILKDEKEKSARVVARLSEFMRYTLYESDQDIVAVEKEIQLLKDYVELESIRLNYTKVTFHHTSDGSAHTIASLLMIPIIENAFKYSSDNKSAFIDVQFHIENKKLHFSIENSIDPDRQLKSSGGIGLKNFQKRLELYYPGRYTYTVVNNEITYSACLNIELL